MHNNNTPDIDVQPADWAGWGTLGAPMFQCRGRAVVTDFHMPNERAKFNNGSSYVGMLRGDGEFRTSVLGGGESQEISPLALAIMLSTC